MSIAKAIDLNIQKGKLIAVIGVNGSGKSTLLKTLTKVQPPLQGDVFLCGKNLATVDRVDLAQKISLVLTQQNFSKNLSVFEFIALGRHPYTNWLGLMQATDKRIIIEAIHRVGLYQLRFKKCNTLSDGQLQKVMIARALVQNTPLIVLDEPTTHLDMYHKVQVLHLLKQIIKDTQKTVIFASHEINLALSLCDEIILINNNKVTQGTPKELAQQNAFDELFPKDLIVFDEKNQIFKVTDTFGQLNFD
ncbi:MAG: ABC transporter ATP-binding protein [Bacteroidota bacterium]